MMRTLGRDEIRGFLRVVRRIDCGRKNALRRRTALSKRNFQLCVGGASRSVGGVAARRISNISAVSRRRYKSAASSNSAPAALSSGNEQPARDLRAKMEQNVRCYKELSKPVLSGLVVLSTSAGFLMSGSPAALMPLVAVSAGTTLQAWSANAFNQVWEVENDALMKRTKRRPLPSGRMTRVHAAAFASASGLAGTGILLLGTNPLTAALGALNIGMYTLMYTPMKTRSVANTWVGSLVGALPPIMGWTAATGTLIAPEPALLGLTLFYWQFPHFFSLAWRSRADYAAGGYKMLPVVDKEGGMRTARAVLRHSLYLCPLPVLASLGGITSSMYAIESIAFNSYLVFLATRFYRKRSNKNAQKVFLASLWYLPLSLALMVYHSSNWKHSEDAPDAERTSIDQFVERAKTRLINLCPHELFTRSNINMDTGDMCPPSATDPLRQLEKRVSKKAN